MNCPRDHAELKTEQEHGIAVDRCHTCNGAWFDYGELAELESGAANEEQRRGTMEYAARPSELPCPQCGQPMHAFNYRAYNLELDACSQEHGFWLDAGESERVREIMRERAAGLERSRSAETRWNRDREAGFAPDSVVGRMRDLFRRR